MNATPLTPELYMDLFNRHQALQATVEELQRERDEAVHARGVYEKLYGVAGMDRNIALNETKTLQAALDAEREKVKELEANQAEYEKCTDEQIVALNQGCLDYEKELSQLQALVLALPKCEGWVSVIQAATDEWHIYDGIFTTEESAHAYAALLTHRATLGATTPAQTDEQRFIEACCERPHDCKWGGTGGCGYEGRKPKGGDGE